MTQACMMSQVPLVVGLACHVASEGPVLLPKGNMVRESVARKRTRDGQDNVRTSLSYEAHGEGFNAALSCPCIAALCRSACRRRLFAELFALGSQLCEAEHHREPRG